MSLENIINARSQYFLLVLVLVLESPPFRQDNDFVSPPPAIYIPGFSFINTLLQLGVCKR
jgi:hypothetical protein